MLTLEIVLNDFKAYAGYGDEVNVSIDSRTEQGESPMHWMATLGDHAGIRILIEAGAQVNAVDSGGNTPTHEAVLRRQATAVAALVEGGADLSLRNSDGQTPLDIAVADGYQPAIDALKNAQRRK